MFGRTRAAPPAPARLRPIRGRPYPPRNAAGSSTAVPREEWIAIPVPAIVDAGVFEAVQAQLDENRRRRREGRRRPGWLLQGLVVCRRCGYAFYGKMARGLVGGRQPADYGYYRCTGTDGHRFGGQAPCNNRSVRSDKLEQAVWRQVEAVLADPVRVAAEHGRRAASARDGKVREDVGALERQIARLRRGMDRLIDGYAEEVIDADEFKPRLAGLKQRLARLQAERDAAAAAHEAERSLQLVIGRLEEFARRVRAGLEGLDWHDRREVIRALVRRIEIEHDQVEVVFRIPGAPPPNGGAPPGPGPRGAGRKPTPVRQHRGKGYGGLAREDAHDVGPALHLLVEALERVGNWHDALGVVAAGKDHLILAYGATIRAAGRWEHEAWAGRCIR